jgi:hypothetical protein
MRKGVLYSAYAFVTPWARSAMVRGELIPFAKCDPKSTHKCVQIHEEIATLDLTYPIIDLLESTYRRFNDTGYMLVDADRLTTLHHAVFHDNKMHFTEREEYLNWIDQTKAALSNGLQVVFYRK